MTTNPTNRQDPAERRRIIGAVIVGTTVEWYDFFTYATMAGLVLNRLFFQPATAGNEGLATILAFLTVGISFLFRPLGAFLAGHFGDKLGRKPVLVATLILMGIATVAIGLLPTHDGGGGDWFGGIGIWAPVLLLFFRILQGVSAGGEWGGAVLIASEHAEPKVRGRMAMFPQLGVPLGMVLSAAIVGIVSSFSGDDFLVWGWRVPFLFSIVLVIVGFVVRRSVDESPVFEEIADRQQQETAPIRVMFAKHGKTVALLTMLFIGVNAGGYMITGGYVQSFAATQLDFDVTFVMLAVLGASALWIVTTYASGVMTDLIGRKKTFYIGYGMQLFVVWIMFTLINTGSPALFVLGLLLYSVPLGIQYGAVSVWFVESFPASVRFSGVSISYALGAILGGAFTPTIATWLTQTFGTVYAIATFIFITTIVSLIAARLLKDRRGIPLTHAFEETGSFDSWSPGDPFGEHNQPVRSTASTVSR